MSNMVKFNIVEVNKTNNADLKHFLIFKNLVSIHNA